MYAKVCILKSSTHWAGTLTYSAPSNTTLKRGMLVEVPFGKRRLKGLVIELSDHLPSDIEIKKVKKITKIYTDLTLNELSIDIAIWLSSYYRSSLKKSLSLFLPRNLINKYLTPPKDYFYSLIDSSAEVKGEVQNKILNLLKDKKNKLSEGDIKSQFQQSISASLNRLIKKGIIKKESRIQIQPYNHKNFVFKEFDKKLSADQVKVLDKIKKAKKPVLIHGVTGSGKTEIYLRLIVETIKKGKQALLLLPEIALTPQMVKYFESYLKDNVAIIHSKLTDAERSLTWWKIKQGACPLVIGSRSALFSPIQEWGLIIIDEEHEWTYKQESAPHYETHLVAEEIARRCGAKLILGSATPKAESYQKMKEGIYDYCELSQRISKNEMPNFHIADLREEFQKKNFSIFSLVLQNKIRERLSKREQIILFVNQRGVANAVVCRDCGYREKCTNCEISLKLHQQGNKAELICHYCHHKKLPPASCPNCQSVYIKNVGIGTQRVEKDLKNIFPEAKVLRADGDVVKKKSFKQIYKQFFNEEYDVLIGTQMIAKGLDFKKVSLIGIILADVGLHMPDFRSSERLFQILTQVAGRCGRGEIEGEVILQTYQPEHPTIKKVSNYNYYDFINKELEQRKKFGYPPFNKMVKFTVVSDDEEKLKQEVEHEKELLEDVFELNKLNCKITSAPCLIPKISNQYYYQVLIRSKKPELIFSYWKPPSTWRVDIDPINTA